ncbi:MAG: site-2 protease family protein [Deltaproteobacteria bacterium]|nr:site-2 protease family protein [Deltaproteobacteria bacterium]MBW1951879.1 site-2 protease family protein [Deltaproteobacteria bacterium]MBW1986978.1 site-2 protease family protein [Deltaproteobacteria bacterium]MBW2134494.1 site-2 protease family protein [Deltaproteobacteria bacterium]
MLQNRITLFKLLGFEVRIDVSWIIIAVLVTWSLSVGLFPYLYENLSPRTYWTMGIVGALGLFISIIIHEFSHSLVARRYGIQMKGITLFIFGGVAEMEEEPPNPRAEFMMAIAGPIASIVLCLVFYGIHNYGLKSNWAVSINGVIRYLAMINGILAAFNLLPAFPLDGGRVLRSLLWGWKNNLRWATRISSKIGSGFGIALIFMAVLQVLNGNFIAGMWWFLIGMFLRGAAQMSYQRVLTRQTLEGEPVRRFMHSDPITVPPSTTVTELVEDYVYKYHFKMFPVVDNGKLLGCITTKQIKALPREEWSRKTVGEVANRCSDQNTISPETDAIQALALMSRGENSRLMVTEKGRLVGILSLKDLLGFLSLKVELED